MHLWYDLKIAASPPQLPARAICTAALLIFSASCACNLRAAQSAPLKPLTSRRALRAPAASNRRLMLGRIPQNAARWLRVKPPVACSSRFKVGSWLSTSRRATNHVLFSCINSSKPNAGKFNQAVVLVRRALLTCPKTRISSQESFSKMLVLWDNVLNTARAAFAPEAAAATSVSTAAAGCSTNVPVDFKGRGRRCCIKYGPILHRVFSHDYNR